MSSPSHSDSLDLTFQTENPNPAEDDQILPAQSEPRSSQIKPSGCSISLNHEDPGREIPSCPQNQQYPPGVVDPEEQETRGHDQGQLEQLSGTSFPLPEVMIPTARDPQVAAFDAPMPSPTVRRPNKRKKGKPNVKKLQAIEKKLQTLSGNLNPIPFTPSRVLDFDKHERVLKRLGLWDFAHAEFDRTIRTDLVAQLIATYDPKLRGSYLNEYRIAVNRADLARAFGLTVKKDKSGSLVEGMDSDAEAFSEESIAFIDDFVSNWVLLHEDTWMMPSEVLNWTRLIKEGHPEKVDWASMVWFMVEKELTQGKQLGDCYYASHLQYLIKSQREELFLEGTKVEEVDLEMEEREEEDCRGGTGDGDGDGDGGGKNITEPIETHVEDNVVEEELNVKLTLGQDSGEKEEGKDEMMTVEESKEDNQYRQLWLFDGKGDRFLQPCTFEVGQGLDSNEAMKQEGKEELEEEEGEDGEEEEPEDGFDVLPDEALERDGLTGNLLQGMETTQIPFDSQSQLQGQSVTELVGARADRHSILSSPSFFVNGGKRAMEEEHDISQYSPNGSNKRLRIDGQWDHKPSEFGMYMEQMQQLADKARVLYETKEHTANTSQQLLLNEMSRRDGLILQLRRKEGEVSRLERELFVMGNLLEGYRKALKDTQKAFSEYRKRCLVPEVPVYRDAGPGGLVLSTTDIEKLRLKQEAIDQENRVLLEHAAEKAGEGYAREFQKYCCQVDLLGQKLAGLENDFKLLKVKNKISELSDNPPEV